MGTILQLVQQRKTLVTLIGGVVLGLALGLIMGWGIWPVEWENATPGHLRSDFQSDYILWVANQYANDGDQERARAKLGVEFWEEGAFVEAVEKLAGEHEGGPEAMRLRALKELTETPADTSVESEPGGGGGLWSSIFKICGVALLAVALVAVIVYFIRRRTREGAQAMQRAAGLGVGVARERVVSEDIAWGTDGPPLVQYPTTYVLGDDHYDPSFSIELENGEFMGECGVGVSEIIGAGKPNQITALEVWLFDKSDIRTVTKVMMSDYAFNDEALRTKLAPKGEPVLAEQGQDIILETKTLRVRAHIAEAEYGMGDLPANSFFDKVTIELAVWVLPEQGGDQPAADVDEYVPPTM